MGTGAYHGTLRAKVFTHSAVECVAGALVALVVVVAVCHDGGLFRAFGENSDLSLYRLWITMVP